VGIQHRIDEPKPLVTLAILAAVALAGCSFRGAAPRTAEELHNTFDRAPIGDDHESGVISDAPGKVRMSNDSMRPFAQSVTGLA
jgi:hypothetical protein